MSFSSLFELACKDNNLHRKRRTCVLLFVLYYHVISGCGCFCLKSYLTSFRARSCSSYGLTSCYCDLTTSCCSCLSCGSKSCCCYGLTNCYCSFPTSCCGLAKCYYSYLMSCCCCDLTNCYSCYLRSYCSLGATLQMICCYCLTKCCCRSPYWNVPRGVSHWNLVSLTMSYSFQKDVSPSCCRCRYHWLPDVLSRCCYHYVRDVLPNHCHYVMDVSQNHCHYARDVSQNHCHCVKDVSPSHCHYVRGVSLRRCYRRDEDVSLLRRYCHQVQGSVHYFHHYG